MSEIKKSARVYFALWPDVEKRKALSAWQPSLQKLCGGDITPADKLHNTLVFLGDVPAERLQNLQLAAEEVSCAAFQLDFDIAKYWGHNHIVYAAPDRLPEKLRLLAKSLEQSLLHHHFKFEQRAYKPHVTLLRHAHWTDSPLPVMQKVTWNIRDFALVQSITDGGKVRYEVLAKFPLGTR